MSRQVDERVVSMQFDNKHFEQNVQTSLSTLDKLRQSLKLDGATKGLENIDAASKKVNMSGLGGAVETVRAKFSALEVMGVTALANITNSAVNAGKRVVSALTIDPIKTGFTEYETKINSIQTIMSNTSSKGTTMDDVTKVIDELNTYADKTIYNFAEMTRNIGTFTAAGVGLEESASAIQGIANLAAASGSTSQQASTAMYQLSQAMAAGTVKLMDWNSVVNAGMGGEKFQEALKATAREHGILIDSLIEDNGSFRDSLQEGWLSADILNETLNKFTVEGAKNYSQSMMDAGKWTQEQADALIKEAQAMEDAATKVKTFSQLWSTLQEAAQSGWGKTWEIIVGDFEEAKDTLTKFSDVIGGMINSASDARNELLQGWKDAGGRTDLLDSIYNTFEGIMSIITPIKEAFRDIFPPITVEQLVGLTQGLKELTEKFKLSEGTADNLKRTFKGVFAIFSIVAQAVKALFSGFSKLVSYISPAGDGILGFTAKIGDFLVGIDSAIKSSNIFNKAIEGIGKILKPIAEGVKTFAKIVTDTFAEMGEKVEGRFKPLATLGEFIQKIFVGMGNAIKKVAPIFASIASKIGEAFKGIQERISGAIQGADYNSLFDIFNSGVFAAILVGIKKFTSSLTGITNNAGGILENIKGILGGVGDALKAFTGQIKANTLKTIAISIAILAASLLVLSLIDSEKLAASLGAITILFGELFGAMAILDKMTGDKKKGVGGIAKLASTMVILSSSLLILSVALKILSTIPLDQMGTALLGMTSGLGVMVGAVYLLGKMKKSKVEHAAKAIKTLSKSLVILSVAMKILSTIPLEQMGVAILGMASGLGALVGAVFLLSLMKEKDVMSAAKAISKLSFSLVIMSAALKILGSMTMAEIGKALLGVVIGLGSLIAAMALLPEKDLVFKTHAIQTLSKSLVVLGLALKLIGSMSWDELARGLVGAAAGLAAMVIAINLLPKDANLKVAGILGFASSMVVLALALKAMGSMSWEEVARALVVLAGSLVIIGVAGKVLKPLVGTITKLAVAMALFGVGVLAIGAGILALGVGLTVLSAALATSGGAIVLFVSSLIGLIPYLIEQIGVGIIKLCEVIAGSADAICKAVTVIILAVVDAIVTCVPAIVEGVFVLVDELLASLVKHTPTIVAALFDFLILLLDGIAAKLPALIQAGVNVIMSFFTGVIDALKSIDPEILIKGILGVGFMTTLMAALAAMAIFTAPAMVGVLGFGAVITELGIVLAAIGALAQIPGLEWLVSEGGDFLQKVGTAIGQFIGGLIGGIGKGISSALPQIGTDLSTFMTNIQPFIDGAKSIDPSAMDGVKTLVGIIMALTGANLLESLTSWLTGGSSLSKFGQEIADFGPYMKAYADSVAGIDVAALQASTEAAKALTAMADTVPNEGGVVAWFAGENSIAAFGEQLPVLGAGLLAFSVSVAGINPDNIVAAAQAAKAITDMASTIPNEGGVAAWFAGENSIAQFGSELPVLGAGLLAFSVSVAGINPDNIVAAATAAKAITDMASTIPNEGGVAAWFAGDNSIASFGSQLPVLGAGLLAFSVSVAGLKPDDIAAAVQASKSIAEMASIIPNSGGVVAWFAGDNSIASFGFQLPILGQGLLGFSNAVEGINPVNVMMATVAAKSLADMANTIPNSGGVVAWFTGDNSIASFGFQLPLLGKGLLGFSNAVEGINPVNVIMAAQAAKSLAEMANTIPNEGGIIAWFTGDNSIAKFGDKLPDLGKGLKAFSDEITGINPINVVMAAQAAKSLAEMVATVPNEGGIKAWFSGENGVVKFANGLAPLGSGLLAFSVTATGVNPDVVATAALAAKSLVDLTNTIPNVGGFTQWFSGESGVAQFATQLPVLGAGLLGFSLAAMGINAEAVASATQAGKALAEMTSIIPNEGGIKSWFSGKSGVAKFAENLPAVGKAINAFAMSFGENFSPENVAAAAQAGKSLAEMTATVPKNADRLKSFGTNLETFGTKLSNYFTNTSGITATAVYATRNVTNSVIDFANKIDGNKIKSACKGIDQMIKTMKNASKIKSDSTDGFSKALAKLAETNVDALVKEFEGAHDKVKKAGETLITKVVDGAKGKKSTLTKACSDLASDAAKEIGNAKTKFSSAGANLVQGFANGISSNTYKATAKARAMARAAANAARKELDEHSPSKVGYEIGDFFGGAFVNAIGDNVKKADKAGGALARASIDGLKSSITRISDVINNDIDSQPTIRPVLDLSDVESGANAIGGILGGRTLSMATKSVGAISASMLNRQNGTNSDVISAIRELGKTIGSGSGDTYTINGITYDDGSNITDAVKTLVRAARVERRR